MNEAAREAAPPAPRLKTLAGARVALLDISKPGGDVFLNHLEKLLKERYGVAEVLRARKPTFAKPAPENILFGLAGAKPHAVIEALAD
jgi:hypothetical protein